MNVKSTDNTDKTGVGPQTAPVRLKPDATDGLASDLQEYRSSRSGTS